MNHPKLTLIAGPNGSGKSTLTRKNFLFEGIPILDPDAIGKTLQSEAVSASAVASGRQVLSTANSHLQSAQSFAVETTLSGQSYLRMMLHAKRLGFEIVLIYIGTENVEINLARIKSRVLAGGHDVPEADVRRRYKRSFKNLPLALERADHTVLFDNSSEQGYRLIAILSRNEKHWLESAPRWASTIPGGLRQ